MSNKKHYSLFPIYLNVNHLKFLLVLEIKAKFWRVLHNRLRELNFMN